LDHIGLKNKKHTKLIKIMQYNYNRISTVKGCITIF